MSQNSTRLGNTMKLEGTQNFPTTWNVFKNGKDQSYLVMVEEVTKSTKHYLRGRCSCRELDTETDATSQVNKQVITKYRDDDTRTRPPASQECLGIILPKSEGRDDGDDERLEKRGRRRRPPL